MRIQGPERVKVSCLTIVRAIVAKERKHEWKEVNKLEKLAIRGNTLVCIRSRLHRVCLK